MRVYRIVSSKHSGKLSASGFAARWNSAGTFVIYTSSSIPLACLEAIVHRNAIELKQQFDLVTIEIREGIIIDEIKSESLSAGWDGFDNEAYAICSSQGDKWINSGKSSVIKVPSAIVKTEFNYLINPNHPGFKKIKIVDIEPFFFDPRIKS